jgi:hypothetical protein
MIPPKFETAFERGLVRVLPCGQDAPNAVSFLNNYRNFHL